MSATVDQLEAAIAALETQRALLGDAVIDAGVAPLRERLALLRSQTRGDQQLKAVSVLFMDIVGSTAMSRALDPEDVHLVIDGALHRFSAVIAERNGRVLQYAGDSLLAAFGADGAHEDDAENAVRAGLALIEQARRIAIEVEAEHRIAGFDVRVGINTGPVLLGGGVDDEGSIRGITVNIAARMEQAAPDGGLRITHDTYRHVRGVFDVAEEPAIVVKGVEEPLRSYLVLRAKPRAFRLARRGVDGVECRMIGRDAELKRLTDAFEDVVADATLSRITIVGDAGIGKSRLLDELSNTLELNPRSVWVFQGRAETHGQMLPYGVVRDVFFWRFQIEESDTPAEARRKFVASLAGAFGGATDEHAALLGQLIGLDFANSPYIAGIAGDPKQIRDRAFHSAAQYFKAIAAKHPVMLQLEDLHWADEGSLDFVNHLAQSCRDVPILIVCAARSALFERRPLWGSGQGDHERIDLAPLARRSSRELADSLLRKVRQPYAALRELIMGGAEGNPFYMEELTKMLIDDGVIVVGGEHWEVVPERLARVHVPPTLVGVLQARLDALPPPEKLTLQAAAVVGHVFWSDALRSIDTPLADALPALMPRELIFGRETTAFEGVGEYVFKHHVLHQVTYESVLKRDRRTRHGRVAQWLVSQGGERVSEHHALIAHHYEMAGDLVEAARHFALAADGAIRSYANDAALGHLERALALTPDDDAEGRYALLASRVGLLGAMGRRDAQRADAEELGALAERLGDSSKRAYAHGQSAVHAFYTADYRRAIDEGERGVALAAASGTPVAGLDAHSCWVNALRMTGRHDDAIAEAERLATCALALGDQNAYLRVMASLWGIAVDRGQYGVALQHFARGLAVSREHGDKACEAAVLGSMGDVQRCLGNFGEAIDLGHAASRLYREIGISTHEALAHINVATAMRLNGDAGAALEPAIRGLEIARQSSHVELLAAATIVTGDVYRALGRLGEAGASYQEALALYRKVGREMMAIECLAGLARVAEAAGRLAEAIERVDGITAYLDAGGTVDGTEDPIGIYLACHDIRCSAGVDVDDVYLQSGHSLLMRRAEPLAAEHRDGFLRRVPSHRALFDAFERAGIVRTAVPG